MKKLGLLTTAAVFAILVNSACVNSTNKEKEDTMPKVKKEQLEEEIVTKEVTIGKQVWMNKNLDVDTFRNGDAIPEVKTKEEWKAACQNEKPACCYYENNSANAKKYGKLYNWFAVNDPRGLAPAGWRIPSNNDWEILGKYLGGEKTGGFGGEAAIKLKSKYGWPKEFYDAITGRTYDANGTNSVDFYGLPGGERICYGAFGDMGETANWWSSTRLYDSKYDAYCFILESRNDPSDLLWVTNRSMGHGLSVRCIKN